jgi:hypothetical protein
MWQWMLSLLASLAADPAQIDSEAPRAAAAVSAAYAATAPERVPPPTPEPPKPDCCSECGGRGYIVHGDGHRTACPCPATCKCKAGATK